MPEGEAVGFAGDVLGGQGICEADGDTETGLLGWGTAGVPDVRGLGVRPDGEEA